jgi:hypothetical protein
MTHRACLALALLALLAVAGCARVRPYQRGALAHRALAHPAWPTAHTAHQHVFQIREGTEGAVDAGGGGCGCN